jgi:hypothetical protein
MNRPSLARGMEKVSESCQYIELFASSVPLQVALIQLIWTIFLTTPAFTVIPGVIEPPNSKCTPLVYGPDLTGELLIL